MASRPGHAAISRVSFPQHERTRLRRNSRKTECGAISFLTGLAVRAAPFALSRNSAQRTRFARPRVAVSATPQPPFACCGSDRQVSGLRVRCVRGRAAMCLCRTGLGPLGFGLPGRMPKRGSLRATRFATPSMVDSKSSWVESMKSHFRRTSCGINAGNSA